MEEKAVAAVDCVGLRHLSGVWAEGSDGARISGFLKVAWEIHGTKENWKRSQHAFTQCVCVPAASVLDPQILPLAEASYHLEPGQRGAKTTDSTT